MKLFLQNIVFFICLFTSISSAQNLTKQEMLEFYPHHIGDYWSYSWFYYDPSIDFGESGIDQLRIPQDTVVNDTTYWLIEIASFGGNENYLERIDTVTGNVLRMNDLYDDHIDCVDNVYADSGDTVSISNNRYLLVL